MDGDIRHSAADDVRAEIVPFQVLEGGGGFQREMLVEPPGPRRGIGRFDLFLGLSKFRAEKRDCGHRVIRFQPDLQALVSVGVPPFF